MRTPQYRGYIRDQSTDRLRQIFRRLCNDQRLHYDEWDEPDYRTMEKQLVVETELRDRGETPSDIMDEVDSTSDSPNA